MKKAAISKLLTMASVVPPTGVIVYLGLLEAADPHHVFRVGVNPLARRCGLTDGTVRKAFRMLKDLGYVEFTDQTYGSDARKIGRVLLARRQ